MWVLSRKINEAVVLTLPDATTVRLVLMRAAKGRGKIGIDAPSHVKIEKGEVHARRQAEQTDSQ